MNIRIKPLAIASVIAVSSLVASHAFAQDAADLSGCQSVDGNYCVSSAGGVVLQGVVGDVSIVRAASTLTGTTGEVLLAGDRVVTDKGSALMVLGPQCKIGITEFSSARLSSANGLTCVSLGGATTTSNNTTTTDMLAGAAVLGGAAAAAATMGSGSDGSVQ